MIVNNTDVLTVVDLLKSIVGKFPKRKQFLMAQGD